jgi:uncharacterized repeat protein (TIGR01451 family)
VRNSDRRIGKHRFRTLLLATPVLWSLAIGLVRHTAAADRVAIQVPAERDVVSAPTILEESLRTNLADYVDGQVPLYEMFEIAFVITNTTATNPYFPYDEDTPPGVEAATGITVDALLLPPGEMDWHEARTLPCFYYQPVEEVGSGDDAALLPVGEAEWHCRFTPDTVGTWRYKIQVTDAGGSSESQEGQFTCVQSDRKGFVQVSQTDPRFFEFSDGTPLVTPLVNVEEGSPFNSLAEIRKNIQKMGENGVRFVRWFPTGEGANFFVVPYADTIRINWVFGDGRITADDPDTGAGKLFSYCPYYYSWQTIPLARESRYRLSFRAEVVGERVLRPRLGDLDGGTIDICSAASTYHESNGETCTYKQDGWHDYSLIVETTGSSMSPLYVALHGLYVSSDAPSPYNNQQEGSVKVHSVLFQRDETGNGDWGPNLLTRSDPDTHLYVDQRAAAKLDEILRLSEQYGVYHKLPLFNKNAALLARFLPDGTIGPWDWNHFYSTEGQASRWYQKAYVRYFVGRWSYSTALHSLELANENNFDENAQDSAFAIAEHVHNLSPRHILMSNSFWGWWIGDFWTDPERGHLMDYSDKHWYADEDGAGCDGTGENCELISNVWTDSAAYVRECWKRFNEYSQDSDYRKPIVRGEGGVAESGTQPQHPQIATDVQGTYYHKKLWAHVGMLGYSCDGEWYPRLFVPYDDDHFPNDQWDLFKMFSAYERFTKDEPLSSGNYVEIGTDLSGSRRITVTDAVGNLRAWGVRDTNSGKVLLWVDNADHTWKNVVDGAAIDPVSATLTLSGLQAGKTYVAQWWDPYASDPAGPGPDSESKIVTQPDGSIALTVQGLERDLALKVFRAPTETPLPRYVSTAGIDGGDCSDASSPCQTVQYAVDRASEGDTIKVASGVYTGVSVRPRDDFTTTGVVTQVVYVSKTVTIRGGYTTTNWMVSDPDANPITLDAQGRGRVFYITGDISPTIEGVTITGGDATGMGGDPDQGRDSGGGVYIVTAAATISNNCVLSNTANRGGGLYLSNSDATFTGNTVTSNTANDAGGGLYVNYSDATLTGNTVAANIAFYGGGLYLHSSDATLASNTVASNTAYYGGGLLLRISSAMLTNNVVADNRSNIMGSGLSVWASSPRLLHTTLARNTGGDGSGVRVSNYGPGYYSTVAMTNTILVSHSVGITVTPGNRAILDATLWGAGAWANDTDWGGGGTIITGTINVYQDPAFVDPDAGDYHIKTGSAASDAGIDAGVSEDIDGDSRIDGHPDIGADELRVGLIVTKRAKPTPVEAGERLTYTIRVTNTGQVGLHATITDTLPLSVTLAKTSGSTLLPPSGPMEITWTANITAPDGVWTEQTVVTVDEGYSGPLTNAVQVTTEEGGTGVYTEVSTAITQPPVTLGVELGPDHTQHAEAGQTIIYDHMVTNTGSTTDSFVIEFASTQGWPTSLLGGTYSMETLVLPLQVNPQMTASFQVSLTVPPSAVGGTENTTITATSQLSPTVRDTATDTTIVPSYPVYLPLGLRNWPPTLNKPTLDSWSRILLGRSH